MKMSMHRLPKVGAVRTGSVPFDTYVNDRKQNLFLDNNYAIMLDCFTLKYSLQLDKL